MLEASEISVLACLYGFDVFVFSETWLNSSVSNDSILIPGYSLPLRKDSRREAWGRCGNLCQRSHCS